MSHKQQGFTLLQMLLYIAMVSIVTFATAQLLVGLQQSREKARVIAEVESQGSFVIDTIARIARNAEGITAPVAGASDSSLTLDVVEVADDPTVIALNAGTIEITEGAGSAVALTSDLVSVTSFSIERLDPERGQGSLVVSLTIGFNSTSSRNEYQYEETFTTSITLR